MSNNGYGLCAHKNNYSSIVKIGNYVEDQIGKKLAENKKYQSLSKYSESTATYVDPSTIKSKYTSDSSISETPIGPQKLPSHMYFVHGSEEENIPAIRFATTSSLLYSMEPEKTENILKNDRKSTELIKAKNIPKQSLAIEIEKKRNREQRESRFLTTTNDATRHHW